MSHNGGNNWLGPNGRESGNCRNLGPLGHYSTGVCGLLATILLLFFLYPTVVALTRPLHILSSTAIVILAVGAWVGTWFVLEVAMDRRLD